jgi:S-adenosylmethionine/arginine decarboxylase-like enzyme
MEHCEEHELFGEHLIMNCKSGNEAVCDKEKIIEFVKELVEVIEMKAHGEPRVEHFGEGKLAGYTLVQLITTSSITCHFCDESKDFYFDLFSCKSFDTVKVRNTVLKYFAPKQNRELFLRRGI